MHNQRTAKNSSRRRRPRVVDLFSGAGLLSGGFVDAGFETIYAAETDSRAVASFNLNHGDVAECRDIREARSDIECEVIIAGPPCQGFSTLGKRDSSDERNSLSLAVTKWVIPTGARVVVIENVPQFLHSNYWKRLTTKMAALGFDHCEWQLDAYEYGAPQKRRRSFTIYSKIGLPSIPPSSSLKATVREAFEGLPLRSNPDGLHVAPIPSEIAYKRFKLIPPEGSRSDLMKKAPHLCPPSWQKLGSNVTDVWGRMRYDQPANTIRCCFQNASKGRYIHPVEHRVISLQEGARLQGIPDWWRFAGDRASIARQIGNGVPLHLGRAVASQIIDVFN